MGAVSIQPTWKDSMRMSAVLDDSHEAQVPLCVWYPGTVWTCTGFPSVITMGASLGWWVASGQAEQEDCLERAEQYSLGPGLLLQGSTECLSVTHSLPDLHWTWWVGARCNLFSLAFIVRWMCVPRLILTLNSRMWPHLEHGPYRSHSLRTLNEWSQIKGAPQIQWCNVCVRRGKGTMRQSKDSGTNGSVAASSQRY